MLNNLAQIAPIKILFTVFTLFGWSRAILAFRKKSINAKELVFWTIVWVFATVIVFIPGKSTVLAHLLGMGRGFDALVFIAIGVLFYIVYRLYVKSNENEHIITKLVREIALEKVLNNKHKMRKKSHKK